MKQRPTFLIQHACASALPFFYVPIFSMIFFSFNKSRLATVWGGFSTQWYGKLLQQQRQVLNAAILSLKIAVVSATFATILGTMAGLALARFRRFRGRAAALRPRHGAAHHAGSDHRHFLAAALHHDGGMDRLARPARLHHHHHRPHHLLHDLCDGDRAVAPLSMDMSIEEAAMDLGRGHGRCCAT
jgi:hypothetical protein